MRFPTTAKIAIVLALVGTLYLLWMLPKPADTPVGTKSIAVMADGARVAYYQTGSRGPRILLLASLGRSVSDFNTLIPQLTNAGFRTLAVDLRGVGDSTLAPEQNSLTLFDLVSDIQSIVSKSHQSGLDPEIVIGHAFGNRIARAYATKHPESVKKIVLVAAGGSQKLQPDHRVSQALGNCFEWMMFPPQRTKEIKYAFFSDGNEVPASWKRGWYKAAAEFQVSAVQATPVVEWRAGGGRAPILIIQGKDDRIAPSATTSGKLQKDFPERVSVVTIGNAGHALLPEAPDQIAKEILNFIAR